VLPAFGNVRDLHDIEAKLAASPDDLTLLYHRAYMLDLLGRNDEARDAYIAVIKRDGGHLGALSNLGTLLFNAGYRSAARLTYAEALKHHPDDVPTLVNLGNAMLEDNDYDAARHCYERAIELDTQSAQAHQGLSHTFSRLGDEARAEEHRRTGFSLRPIAINAFRGEGMPVSLLLLGSPMRGNVPVNDPLDDRTFLTVTLFTDYYDPELPLPPHDVIVNGIGDADLCDDSLVAAEVLLRDVSERVINPPQNVRGTGRVAMAQRLRGIDGLIVPMIRELGRDELGSIDTFPVLLRPPGYHTGEFFEMASSHEELATIAPSLPGERVLAIELLDARGRDGMYRKYRVLSIGGELYPVHLARSSKWKVHYFSADLVRTPEAIAEEEAFLRDPRRAVGEGAWSALQEAARRIDLDYFGIDFALDPDGNALFFEANATMRAVIPLFDGTNEERRRAAIAANSAFKAFVLSRRS
jgi:hypothetical protein